MIVDQNGPAEAIPEDAGDMHQAQVVEEMNEQGIVPPRSVAEGTATDRRKCTIKYRAWLGLQLSCKGGVTTPRRSGASY